MPANSFIQRLPFHYGWLIAFAGMLGIFACLGFSRFVLGMILPSMSAALSLSYVEMGLLSTGNFLGYLIAVLIAGNVVMQLGARVAVFLGLSLSWLSMLLIGLSSNISVIGVLYLFTGIGSGITNVSVMGLVTRWFASDRRGRASGFVVIGSGFALIISGMLVPWINSAFASDGWRIGWAVSAAMVLMVSVINLLLIRNRPEDIGLRPLGAIENPEVSAPTDLQRGLYLRGIAIYLGLIYLLFGFSYVIYITFIVTALVQDYGFAESIAGQFWSTIGILSLLSGPVFGTLSDRIGRGRGLMVVFSIQMLSYGLIATGIHGLPLHLSIVLFGITVWSIPSIMAASSADYFGPLRAPAAFGYITFIFSLGQITGPLVSGIAAEATGQFSTGFLMAAAASALAVALSAFLKKPEHSSG